MLSLVGQLWLYMKHRKKFWLLPFFIISVTVGGLLAVTQGTALAPFIYAIF